MKEDGIEEIVSVMKSIHEHDKRIPRRNNLKEHFRYPI
jgi:hypothetical protein